MTTDVPTSNIDIVIGSWDNNSDPSYTHVVAPEPLPNWAEAIKAWQWAWHLHTYGFGILFLLLGLSTGCSLYRLRRRFCIHKYLTTINGLLLVCSLSRSLCLLIDPYESNGKLPVVLNRIFYSIAFPCLSSSFSLTQLVFMRITRVNMGSRNIKNYRVLAAVITTHFAIVIVIDITVAYRNNLKLLILLCQSIFITWGLILCFGFIYSGFKMTQYTNETQKVLKQLITYIKVKEQTMKDGNTKELALHRISKPKLNIAEDESRINGFGSDSSLTDSSDSLSFFNEAHLELDEDAIAKVYANHLAKSQRKIREQKNKDRLARAQVYLNFNLKESSLNISSGTEYFTEDTPSTNGVVYEDTSFNSPRHNKKDAVANIDVTQHESHHLNLVPKTACASTSSVFTIDQERFAYVNYGADIKSLTSTCELNSPTAYANGYLRNTNSESISKHFGTCSSDVPVTDVDVVADITQTTPSAAVPSENGLESGYMADTEQSSPKRKRRRGKHKDHDVLQEEEDEDIDDRENNNSPVHIPYQLPIQEGSIGLHRIRQGRVIHQAVKVTYITTLIGFILCVMELYAMFGVYGVLSNETVPEPWPWLVFHSMFRLFEFCMGGTMAYATHIMCNHRHRYACKRRPRQNLSKC